MQVDYEKFPDVPEGCQLNPVKGKKDVFQVFRTHRVTNPETGRRETVRETVGRISNGAFSFSQVWLDRKALAEKEAELAAVTRELEELKTQGASLKEAHAIAVPVIKNVEKAIEQAQSETRDVERVVFPAQPIYLGALMCALTGSTACTDIANFVNLNKDHFRGFFKDLPDTPLSHDTVYRAFMRIAPERFERFYLSMIEPMVHRTPFRVISGDGQAVRATGLYDPAKDAVSRPYMLMHFYDTNSRVCLAYKLIDKKSNEIVVSPGMLETIDVRNAVVTADAMSCQVRFAQAVLDAGADYCLALKGNQDRSWQEVQDLFKRHAIPKGLRLACETELAHGRIESRTVSLLPGSHLSRELCGKWPGLEDGHVIRVVRRRDRKAGAPGGETTSFYITSMPTQPAIAQRAADVVRGHWWVENGVHRMADIHFDQDRIQARNTAYITNRTALNKLALAMLEHYRHWLWENGFERSLIPLSQVRMRCQRFEEAVKCLACSQGLLLSE